jgi:hypothetical protein
MGGSRPQHVDMTGQEIWPLFKKRQEQWCASRDKDFLNIKEYLLGCKQKQRCSFSLKVKVKHKFLRSELLPLPLLSTICTCELLYNVNY